MNKTQPHTIRQDFLKDIVSQFVQRRKELNLTQEDVNYRLGVADRLVGKWEVGIRTPSNSFSFMCWAEALDSRLILVPKDAQEE